MNPVTCEECGTICEVDEAKPGLPVAWCLTCDYYAKTSRNLSLEHAESLQEQADEIYEAIGD